MKTNNINAIMQAVSVASIYHKDQKRKAAGGSPYVNHLIEVAYLLTNLAEVDDIVTLQAAVLHDILEDTAMTQLELLNTFGTDVTELVLTLTDDKDLSLEDRRQYQIDHIQSASWSTKVIKLADHCSNISSIPKNWSKERVDDYFQWSLQVASLCFDASPQLAEEYKQRLSITKSSVSAT